MDNLIIIGVMDSTGNKIVAKFAIVPEDRFADRRGQWEKASKLAESINGCVVVL